MECLYCQLKENQYIQLPKLNRNEIEILFVSDFWDGPMTGMLFYRSKKYWFEVCSESIETDYNDYYRRFLVIKLTGEQIQ